MDNRESDARKCRSKRSRSNDDTQRFPANDDPSPPPICRSPLLGGHHGINAVECRIPLFFWPLPSCFMITWPGGHDSNWFRAIEALSAIRRDWDVWDHGLHTDVMSITNRPDSARIAAHPPDRRSDFRIETTALWPEKARHDIMAAPLPFRLRVAVSSPGK
jgi:hypothetical protein